MNALRVTAGGLVGVCLLSCASGSSTVTSPESPMPSKDIMQVYIGTYTQGWSCGDTPCESKGIYRATFNPETGALTEPTLAAESVNPSYVAVHPSGKYVYAVNEVGDFEENAGSVSAFVIEADGRLTLLNRVSSLGADPCHLSVTENGGYVLVANYSSGSVASFKVASDGSLEAGQAVQHEGSGPHERQEGPHAHFIAPDPKGRLIYAADLGLDRVLAYELNETTGQLTAAEPAFGAVPDGSGPRHVAVHPTKGYVFVNNELAASVTVLAPGTLTPIQTLSTLPEDYEGGRLTAEIQLSKDGRFLYVSNRGHDSIAVFSVDEATGQLVSLGHTPTQGHWPRDFKVDPSGRFLLVANKKAGNVIVFRIDERTGQLQSTGHEIAVSQPVSIAFVR